MSVEIEHSAFKPKVLNKRSTNTRWHLPRTVDLWRGDVGRGPQKEKKAELSARPTF
jgi:hypothetical protein